MSLPDEIVNAQERVYKAFVSRELSFKLWPKHFINGQELQWLYDTIAELKKKNERLTKVGDKLSQRIEDEYPPDASEQHLVRDWRSSTATSVLLTTASGDSDSLQQRQSIPE